MNKNDFIKLVTQRVTECGITVHLNKAHRIRNSGVLSSGVFDHRPHIAELKVATKNPGWFPIFVHEYGHFTQWQEKNKIWTTYIRRTKSCEKLFFPKAKLKRKALIGAYEATLNLELDCEKRTVALIKKYDLPIDIETYIRTANAYIFYYTFLKDTRQWYSKRQPYRVKQILELMPTTFLTPKQYETLPSGYESLVRKFCLN